MQIKRPLYKDSIGSWRNLAEELDAIIEETKKYSDIFDNMSKSLDNNAEGPISVYNINWGLSPSFDYSYDSVRLPAENSVAKEANEL